VRPKLRTLARDLAAGKATSRGLVEACLVRIDDTAGEGALAFLSVYRDAARLTADWIDGLRKLNVALPPFAGVPISIKDLFDVAGETTRAGSIVLAGAAPASRDATAVARLRAAGFVPIGRTNMTEFAFSAIGTNPHYGTPANVWDRSTRRIPGGSSSGAAISITDGMAVAAIGTDTGGSCRIPAALNGIVGFKPTARRIPQDGVIPLAPSLDSVGLLCSTLDDAAILDAVLSGDEIGQTAPAALRGLRLAVPQSLVLDGLDETVARRFDMSLQAVSGAGAIVTEIPMAEWREIPAINAKGGFPAAEAYAWHRRLIAEQAERYDPRILGRILRGREQEAADYIDLVRARSDLMRRVAPVMSEFDAFLLPTVPALAPPMASLDDDDAAFTETNILLLRNPAITNFLDGCAITMPCSREGDAPVGLTVQGPPDSDHRILAIAAALEPLFVG